MHIGRWCHLATSSTANRYFSVASLLPVSLISCAARKLLLCPFFFFAPTFFTGCTLLKTFLEAPHPGTLAHRSISTKLPLVMKYMYLYFLSKRTCVCPAVTSRGGHGLNNGKPQFKPAFLPISGACPRITLLGLRMNWHWVSGGRHWSSSSTPGQSVGLVVSRPVTPPSPPALLPPSRMWLILMLKGNSWPK